MLSNLKKSTIGRIYIYLYVCVCVKNVVQPTCSINNRRKASSAHQDFDPQILDKMEWYREINLQVQSLRLVSNNPTSFNPILLPKFSFQIQDKTPNIGFKKVGIFLLVLKIQWF